MSGYIISLENQLMFSKRNILSVFIASPKDVTAERLMTRKVVDELNISLKKINWQIELLGWEDTLPGISRPQELINKELDLCDLFIGILWKRWGTKTGKYSSGFKEEFERAIKRQKDTKIPQIWLAFKKIDSDSLNDPGDQLKNVLKFKEQQISQRKVLFKEFEDVEDWRVQLSSWLLQYVLELSESLRSIKLEENTAKPVLISESPTDYSLQESDLDPTHEELKETFASISNVIANQPLAHLEEGNTINLVKVARIQLFTTAITSHNYTNEFLQTHTANYLYKNRVELNPTGFELMFLFKALLYDTTETIPCWFWFRNVNPETIKIVLLKLVFHENDAQIRLRAITLLELSEVKLDSDDLTAITEFVLHDKSENIRLALLKFWSRKAKKNDLQLLNKLLNDSDNQIKKEARNLLFKITAQRQVSKAFKEFLSTDAYRESNELLSVFQLGVKEISNELLNLALKNSKPEIRLIAINELSKRNSLDMKQLLYLIKDNDKKVKKVVYSLLPEQIDKKEAQELLDTLSTDDNDLIRYYYDDSFSIDEPNAIQLGLYKKFSFDELFSKVNFFDFDTNTIIRALAKFYRAKSLDLIRNYLEDEFEELYKESYQRYLAKYGHEMAKDLKSKDQFLQSFLTASSLSILADYGTASDINFARKYIKDSEGYVVSEAVRLIERFGDKSDLEGLIDITRKESGRIQILATKAILKISKLKDTVQTLSKLKNEKIIKVVVHTLLKKNTKWALEIFESLIEDENSTIRKMGLAGLISKYNSNDLESLLLRCLSKQTYYYNIIYWLDRVIYAPAPLNEKFKQEIKSLL